ncbi:hypothetical protein E2C01_071984 [Portunus trituberculatus]|uniref:Uncharacterized protein n=1 Tax=Portunus trituberculatus TaxID=210409 RepID=A0A5B7I7Q7_PORTR|nr:hypothetical protein [Portunus trituberculatus]
MPPLAESSAPPAMTNPSGYSGQRRDTVGMCTTPRGCLRSALSSGLETTSSFSQALQTTMLGYGNQKHMKRWAL